MAELDLSLLLGEEPHPTTPAAIRLLAFEEANLAPLVLSLLEASETSAEEAAVAWLRLALDFREIAALKEGEAARLLVESHLARIAVVKASTSGYVHRLLTALLPEASGTDAASSVLSAVLRNAAPEPGTQIELWPLLSEALRLWPTPRLTALVLAVLPRVFDNLSVQTPDGCVKGSRLDCSSPAGPVNFSVRSPVLKCMHCLFCCAVALSVASPAQALTHLRSACDVTRSVLQSQPSSARVHCISVQFVAFLQALLKAAPDLRTMPPPRPAPLRGAKLLLQALRRKMTSIRLSEPDCLVDLDVQLKDWVF